MSLINDKQRESAQQPRPEAKVIQVADVSNAGVGAEQEFQLSPNAIEQEQPVAEDTQEFVAPVVQGLTDFSLSGQPSATQAPTFKPQNPLDYINSQPSKVNIWRTLTPEESPDAPNVLQANKPTVYDSSQVYTDAQRLNAQGIAGLNSSFDKYNSEQARAAQAEQELKERARDRTQNVNIPRKEQPWGFNIGQMFNDIIFGNKESQQATNVGGRFNPLAGEYGKQGSGLGGAVKYILSTPLNATVGLAADVNQQTVNLLQGFGVDKESAQRFSRTGFLGVAADKIWGRQAVDDVGKRFGLQQDFSRTEKTSALGQALVGNQVGDLNDPAGNRKGVFYRANRPLRTQQQIEAARAGKYDVLNIGSIGQAIADDPTGAIYEIVANVLDPAGNKIGDLAAGGLRRLVTKVPKKVPELPVKQVFETPKPGVRINKQKRLPPSPELQPRLALPPGKVSEVPVEQQIEQMFNGKIPPLKQTQQLPPAAELPMLPGTPPPGGFPKVTVGNGRPVTATRVLPTELPSSLETLVTPVSDDVWKTPVDYDSPLQMEATLESAFDSNLPKLPGDTKLPDPWTSDYLDYSTPVTNAPYSAFTPTKAPRVYEGSPNVVQRALPPAITKVDEAIEEAVEGTPSEVALRVGIGTPSKEAIVFSDEIKVAGVDNAVDDVSEEVTEVIPTQKIQEEQEFLAADEFTDDVLTEADNVGNKLISEAAELGKKMPTIEQASIGARLVDVAKGLNLSDINILKRAIGDDGLLSYVFNNSYKLTSEYLNTNVDLLRDKLVNETLKRLLTLDKQGTQKLLLQKIALVPLDKTPKWMQQRFADAELEWSGKQWRRKGKPKVAANVPSKPKEQNWATGKTQPLPSIRWKKHPLAGGAVKYINPQELDKLWLTDRVGNGGVDGIGNRYKEAGDFITRNANGTGEAIIMPEITVRNDGSIVFTDGRHRFAYLRDNGFTEIPVVVRNSKRLPENVKTRSTVKAAPVPTEALEEAAEQLATHKQVIQAPLQQLDDLFDTTVDFGRKTKDELPARRLTPDDVLDALENSAKLSLPPAAKKSLSLEYGDEIIESLDTGDYFGLMNLLQEADEDMIAFALRVADENNAAIASKVIEPAEAVAEVIPKQVAQVTTPKPKSPTKPVTSAPKRASQPLHAKRLSLADLEEAFETKTPLQLTSLARQLITKRFGQEALDALEALDKPAIYRLLKNSNNVEQFFSEVLDINSKHNNFRATTLAEQKLLNETRDTDGLLKHTVKMPQVSHGSALANWSPNYSLETFGSRGELGSGLYVAKSKSVATDYARATLGENVSSATNASDIAPAVYELSTTLENTLSARAKLPLDGSVVKLLMRSLPEQMQTYFSKSLYRDKSITYVGLLNKIEANIVRSGLTPDEKTLQSISDNLSNTLRMIGYDSVYDSKSGFGVVLDESKVTVAKSTPVSKAESPTQAALARYNADAYAAKFYDERLTTDANLRDSAYKLLSQLESNVDDKLAEVQQEIIKRGLNEQQTILPPRRSLTDMTSANEVKPQTAKELLDTIEPKSTNPCEF